MLFSFLFCDCGGNEFLFGSRLFLRAKRITRDVSDRLAVDLKGGGTVELNRDLFAADHRRMLFAFDVLAFKDRGEENEGAKAVTAVNDDRGNGVSEAILLGSDHHTAAVIAAVHTCRDPSALIVLRYPVDRNGCLRNLIRKKEKFNGDRRVVDLRFTACDHILCHSANLAVDAEADTVDNGIVHTVYCDDGEIFKIAVERKQTVNDSVLHTVHKIVARTCLREEELARKGSVHNISRETRQSAVATAKNNGVFGRQRIKKHRNVGLNEIFHLVGGVFILLFYGENIFFRVATVSQRIVENVNHIFSSFFVFVVTNKQYCNKKVVFCQPLIHYNLFLLTFTRNYSMINDSKIYCTILFLSGENLMSFEKLEAYFKSLPARGIPAAEVIVMQNHKEVFRSIVGCSDEAGKVPATKDDLYFLYSSTKVMTCVAALALIEDGKLGLDDPVSKYIPAYASLTVKIDGDVVPAKETMLVRHLFMMTGGLTYDVSHPVITEFLKKNPAADTLSLVSEMAKMPLAFEPGTRYQYSLCHDVLAAVVEVASGMRFSDYVNVRIAKPLGMTDLHFHMGDAGVMERLSAQYKHEGTPVAIPVPKTNFTILSPNFESGGGGIITTTECYILLADALANGGVGKNGNRILKEETVLYMSQNHLSDIQMEDYYNTLGNFGYGYGLGVRTLISQSDRGNLSKSLVGEFGWGGAAGTYFLADPKAKVAIYYSQQVLNMSCDDYQNHPHNMIRDLAYEGLGY